MGIVGGLQQLGRRVRYRNRGPQGDMIDAPLLWFSKRDPWTIRDAFEGTQIFGATGSGKTSGSGQAIAKAFLRCGMGGIVLTAKPDERATWERYAHQTGRSNSLVIFSPSNGQMFNFLDYELSREGDGAGLTKNIVDLLTTMPEVARRGGRSSGMADDGYWQGALAEMLKNAVEALILATGSIDVPSLYRLIKSAPPSPEACRDPEWQERSFCFQCLRRALARSLTPGQQLDLDLATDYWLERFPEIADKTRSIIVSCFTTMADDFLRSPLRELFSKGTSITPEATFEGAIIIIDMPTKEWGVVGRYAQVLWKRVWQQAVERRPVGADTRPVFLWADESHNFVTSTDQEFQSTARSARACTVYLTQNLPNYYAAIGGGDARSITDSLLGCFQTKIFHANGDHVTNQWAEEMIAKNWTPHIGTSSSNGQHDPRTNKYHNQTSATVNHSLDPQVLAGEFTTLRTGGPFNKFQVDGVLFQPGRCWALTGGPYIRVTFDQRH